MAGTRNGSGRNCGSSTTAAARRAKSLRVFPLSDWTERDIWAYVAAEKLRVASLYFAAERPTVTRDGHLLIVDDDRFRDRAGMRRVRVRTVGCWPLTGAMESEAATIEAILAEIATARRSGPDG